MKRRFSLLQKVILLTIISLVLCILLNKRLFINNSNELTKEEILRAKDNRKLDQIYDKIFILNLPRSTERRKRMEKTMEEFGIENYEFITGIDGRELEVEILRKEGLFSPDISVEKYAKMTPGEVACSMSHIKAWNTTITRGYKSVMICEDDSRIETPNIHKLASLVEQDIPKDWEILHWSTNKLSESGRVHIAGRIYLSYAEWSGAVCYALSFKGAQKLVATAYPITVPVDVYISAFTRPIDRKTYIILPPPISFQKYLFITSDPFRKKHSVIDSVDIEKGKLRSFKGWWDVFWEMITSSD